MPEFSFGTAMGLGDTRDNPFYGIFFTPTVDLVCMQTTKLIPLCRQLVALSTDVSHVLGRSQRSRCMHLTFAPLRHTICYPSEVL